MATFNDSSIEHRREHARIALFLHNGNDPSSDEVDDHIAEMDRLESGTGGLHVHQFLDTEATVAIQKRQERDQAQAQADGAREDADRRRQEREDRRLAREDEATKRLEARAAATQPSANVAVLSDASDNDDEE